MTNLSAVALGQGALWQRYLCLEWVLMVELVFLWKKKTRGGLLSSLQQAENYLQAKKVPFPK